jgi:hypothetical protein
MNVQRKPIPRAEFVTFEGRPYAIDHKSKVLSIEPRAHIDAYGVPPSYVVWSHNEFDEGAPDEEARVIGTGHTEAGAWRDAHLFLTETEPDLSESRLIRLAEQHNIPYSINVLAFVRAVLRPEEPDA